MTRKATLLSGLAGIALTAGAPALAQDDEASGQSGSGAQQSSGGSGRSGSGSQMEVTPLTDYDATQIEGAWSADNMREADVYGEDGDIVGYVQNIIIGADNTVTDIVIETDNWFDLGDRAISVPWDRVELTPQTEGISVPLDENEMNDFTLFADDQTAASGGQAFRASDVLDDYAVLEGGTEYGYVSDLIFSQDGTLSSVLVTPDVGFADTDYAGGYYAYPYYGYDYGYDPYADTYTLPYTEDAILEYGPFDSEFLQDTI